jgi:hypothetical protein
MADVRAHLAECGDCARRARRADLARRRLTQALDEGGSGRNPSLWPGIRTTLLAERLIRTDEAGEPTVERIRGRGFVRWLAPLAAAAALVAVLQGTTGLFEGAEPLAPAPRAPEIALPSPGVKGTLRRLDPLEVESVVPFRGSRPTLPGAGWPSSGVSAVGFRGAPRR